MPLSSSVPGAKRQLRTIVAVPQARSNGLWDLTCDLDQRIADVNVRTGAHALSEVHSSLLFHDHVARAIGTTSASFHRFNPFEVQPHYVSI